MASPYRDSTEALRIRLRAAGEAAAAEEARYTALFWKEVAPTLGLAPPRPEEAVPAAAKVEALAAAVEEREARLEALNRTDRDFPAILAAWSRPAAEVPPCRPSAVLGLGGAMARPFVEDRCLPAFESAVGALGTDGPAAIEQRGASARATSFSLGGVPFQARCETYMTQRSGDWVADVTVQTTVPALFGEVELRPQGFGAELAIALHLAQDIKVGDADFDGTFVVRGHEATAKAILSKEVRARLLAIAKQDIPRLVVSRGLATLLWHFEPSAESLRAAVEALATIRRAPACRSLRDEPCPP